MRPVFPTAGSKILPLTSLIAADSIQHRFETAEHPIGFHPIDKSLSR